VITALVKQRERFGLNGMALGQGPGNKLPRKHTEKMGEEREVKNKT
jgi:hypothetical protein